MSADAVCGKLFFDPMRSPAVEKSVFIVFHRSHPIVIKLAFPPAARLQLPLTVNKR